MYCVGGSLKNLCHFEMGGGGGLANVDVIRGGGVAQCRQLLTGGGKICQNLADVICERSLSSKCRYNAVLVVKTVTVSHFR